MIVHITGAPGSGKSTIGNILKKKLKHIKVYDIDNLYHDFINIQRKISDTFPQKFQKYIDELIKKHKNIIFVGLHYSDPHFLFKNAMIDVKPFKINFNTEHLLFIDIDMSTCIKQLFSRVINNVTKEVSKLIDDDVKFVFNFKQEKQSFKYWNKKFIKDKYIPIKNKKIVSYIKNLCD